MTKDEGYMASAARDGFVGLAPELIEVIRDVERAAGQYDFHAAKVTCSREERNRLQSAKVEARKALSAALLAHLDAVQGERDRLEQLANVLRIERDDARRQRDEARVSLATLTRERDEARRESFDAPPAPLADLLDGLDRCLSGRPDSMDISVARTTVAGLRRALAAPEMVERAAREIYDEGTHLIKWDDPKLQQRDYYIALATRALAAALGCQSPVVACGAKGQERG
jgi:hypothetical protein